MLYKIDAVIDRFLVVCEDVFDRKNALKYDTTYLRDTIMQYVLRLHALRSEGMLDPNYGNDDEVFRAYTDLPDLPGHVQDRWYAVMDALDNDNDELHTKDGDICVNHYRNLFSGIDGVMDICAALRENIEQVKKNCL